MANKLILRTINTGSGSSGSTSEEGIKYGLMYNWYAATDLKNICASGWRVPESADFNNLVLFLDPSGTEDNNIAGGELKETGLTYWNSPNTGATNSVGFNARGGGSRFAYSMGMPYDFLTLKDMLTLWAKTEGGNLFGYDTAINPYLFNDSPEFGEYVKLPKYIGSYLRLIKNSTSLSHGQSGTYTGNNGEIYRTICIGTQEWLAENLVETRYRYDFPKYGYLYNAYTITDQRNLAADGWRVATQNDWITLINYADPDTIGGYPYVNNNNAAIPLKEKGTAHWNGTNENATNELKFNLRGSGSRDHTAGNFGDLKNSGSLYTSTEYNGQLRAVDNGASYNGMGVWGYVPYMRTGLGVRLIKNSTSLSHGDASLYIGNDGKIYRTICIGTQEWLADNLAETRYRNGDNIPNVTNASEWSVLTTGARCAFNNNESNVMIGTEIPEITDPSIWMSMGASETGALCAYNNDWDNVYYQPKPPTIIQKLQLASLPSIITTVNYGFIYNWHVVSDLRNIAAPGWHVPTIAECVELILYLGGEIYEQGGAKYAFLSDFQGLKDVGDTYWDNSAGTNITGFTGRGAGYRAGLSTGRFAGLKQILYCHVSDKSQYNGKEYVTTFHIDEINYNYAGIFYDVQVLSSERDGGSIRLVKDNTSLSNGEMGTYTGNDGKTYRTICIGNQEWMAENLCETRYRDNMPNIFNYYYLYNWYAATDARNIAADGWRLPSMDDYGDLISFLDPSGTLYANTAGGSMKETGHTYWNSPNEGATNISNFNARGSGIRIAHRNDNPNDFLGLKEYLYLWTSFNTGIVDGVDMAGAPAIIYSLGTFMCKVDSDTSSNMPKVSGCSIRLIKNSTTLSHGDTSTYIGNDGRIYRTICIGTQEWMADDLRETQYRNGNSIPNVTNASEWISLTTGARCAYNNDEESMLGVNILEVTDASEWISMISGAFCAYDNDWNNAYVESQSLINNSRKLILGSPSINIEPPPLDPVQVTTLNVTNIEGYSATGGGNVTAGGYTTRRGICWSTSINPTISDASMQYPTNGEGVYYLNMTGLNGLTNYYVRAWAYNNESFVYGNNVQFSTPEVFTACATYQPYFPYTYEETGLLNCDDVSLTSGTLGDYVIDWRNGSTNGEIVFVSGSRFEADPSVQQIHPLENEIVFGGLLYPVIRSIYINSNRYSSYNIPGHRYSPDLRDCLDPINVEPLDCDSSVSSNYVYPVNYLYENLYDPATLKSRTIKYNLCSSAGEHVEYLAWSLDAQLVPEQLKIYYCTSTNSEGTLIDNFIHGLFSYGVITNLYPANYPDGSARTVRRMTSTPEIEDSIKFITNLSNIPYNEGDYLRIEIVGSVYQPELDNTNWRLGIKSFYASEIDCSFFDASVGQIDYSFEPSIKWDPASCRYEIFYKTLKPIVNYNWQDYMKYNPMYNNYPWLIKYTMLKPQNYNLMSLMTDSSVGIYLTKNTVVGNHSIYARGSNCTQCENSETVTYNLVNINNVSTYTVQFTSSSDYEVYKLDASLAFNAMINSVARNSPDSSVQYYGACMFRLYDSFQCGDNENIRDIYFWINNDLSWNDVTRTIYIPCAVPTISNYIIDMSSLACNNSYFRVTFAINSMKASAEGRFSPAGPIESFPMSRTIRSTAPFYIRYLSPTIYDINAVESFCCYSIHDVMLNNICDLSSRGFIYDVSYNHSITKNSWALFNYWDRATLTNPNDPLNNWRLERRRLLTTLNREDIQWDLVWEVSLGQVIYP